MILKSSFIRPYKGCYEEKKEENIDSELETYINEMIAKRAEQRKTKILLQQTQLEMSQLLRELF